MPSFKLSERSAQAHRLHQFRIEARLTCAEVDDNAGWKRGTCFAIEYGKKPVGTAAQIKAAISLFVPGERRMLKRGDGTNTQEVILNG